MTDDSCVGMGLAEQAGFELLCTVLANGTIPVSKYKSKDTGIVLFTVNVEGPIIHGYFVLATEAHDDDGLPHTLEHLVFMGSENFPYKGVLDLLANRCLASGTNAWTDTDHTCYTMTTAGSEGFLQLLPIYLDHILYPTLTESSYITEIHHINGNGEDAGVVYGEMQARENTADSLGRLALLRAMYPGICGYKSETGGILRNLRESTSHKKVCDYHKKFYCPENLCLIVTGQIETFALFQALKPLLKKIESKNIHGEFQRPWMSPVPPLEKSEDITLDYPSDDIASGVVYLSWRGPSARDQYTLQCLSLLLEYLCDSPIAPLQREFVEREDAVCSMVSDMILENMECCLYISYRNVDIDCLYQIKDRTLELLKKIVSKEEPLDMNRIGVLVQKNILEALNSLEEKPHQVLALGIIGHFLYGNTKEELEVYVNPIANLTRMKEEKEEFWLELIRKYLLITPCVQVKCRPSLLKAVEIGESEKKRIQQQIEALGETGLKEKQDSLDAAMQVNEITPPKEVLTNILVPDVKGIQFHHIDVSSNLHLPDSANPSVIFKIVDMPIKFQVDSIHTNFVQICALLNSSSVPHRLRYYLPLLCPLLLECPILRDGVLISHEEVVAQLEEDILVNSSSLGIMGHEFSCGDFGHLVVLCLKVELAKYQKGVKWLYELLTQIKFPAERIKIVATRLSNNIYGLKRRGQLVVRTLLSDLIFTTESNHHFVSMFRQEKFLASMIEELEKNPNKVIQDLEHLREIITQPENWHIHMGADIDKLQSMVSAEAPWKEIIPFSGNLGDVKINENLGDGISFSENVSAGRHIICGLGAVESSYMISCISGIPGFQHPDLPAIRVFLQYLTQVEGPMWRQIRGQGLSYYYSIYEKPDLGLLYLVLSHSTHLVSAYQEARNIVRGYCEGKLEFTEVELEACRSSLIFEIIESEKSVSDTSLESLLCSLRGIEHTYNKEMLQKVAAIRLEDLKPIGVKYILPLFNAALARSAVVVHPSKVDEIVIDFAELGIELTKITSFEDSFLCQCD